MAVALPRSSGLIAAANKDAPSPVSLAGGLRGGTEPNVDAVGEMCSFDAFRLGFGCFGEVAIEGGLVGREGRAGSAMGSFCIRSRRLLALRV